jgi:hypothetical protein
LCEENKIIRKKKKKKDDDDDDVESCIDNLPMSCYRFLDEQQCRFFFTILFSDGDSNESGSRSKAWTLIEVRH